MNLSLIPISTAFAEAQTLKEQALESAALIGRVSCAEEQTAAVEAQRQLGAMVNHVETCRVKAKAPALEYGKQIDDAAKKFVADLKDERNRIDKLVADFQALEMAKVRAAQAAENERLTQLEREREAALAKVETHDQRDAVQAEFNEKARETNPPLVIARAEGQIVKEVWQFAVTDVWALAHAHPTCVKAPEVLRSQVTLLLDQGVMPVGVKAWKETKATVRARSPVRRIE